RVVDHAVRVGARDHLGAELLELLHRVDGDVSGTRHDAGLALDRISADLQHLLDEVDDAVAGRLLAHERAAPLRALAGQHAGFVSVRDAFVLAEQVADLALADADVPGRDVRELPEVPIKLRHEALAEAHDLVVGLALRAEVRAALRAADRHSGDGGLERLLEAQELDDAQIDGRMEAQPPLVRAERAVESHPETAIDVHFPAVVLPRDAEDDLPLRLADSLDDFVLRILRVLAQHRGERLGYFRNRLMELGFSRVSAHDVRNDASDSCVDFSHVPWPCCQKLEPRL